MVVRKKIPPEVKIKLHRLQQGKCMYCGRRLLKNLDNVDLDHITPLARNGKERESNYQLLCKPCNRRKGPYTDDEFRRMYKLAKLKNPPKRIVESRHFQERDKIIDFVRKNEKEIKDILDAKRRMRNAYKRKRRKPQYEEEEEEMGFFDWFFG